MHANPKLAMLAGVALAACGGSGSAPRAQDAFTTTPHAEFDEPWAMDFLPRGRLLVSEKPGALKIYDIAAETTGEISGVPEVEYGGQGGFGDVVLHPDYADNDLVYVSYAEPGDGGTAGAAVARARLALTDTGGALEDLEVIWRQQPKVTGRGHYGHRIAFGPEGYLWISSGERQEQDPSQDMQTNLGKIVRLHDDGSVPDDNPFADEGGVTAEIWSFGHRNPLGLAFDAADRLWNTEMGPRGGDELNHVERGANYGWPVVSNGRHYRGGSIPDHETQPELNAPAVFWEPVISPSSLMFYGGDEFPEWRNDAFIGGLSSQALVRVTFDGTSAREAERFDMGARVRAAEQGPDGAIWLLEDGPGGRLLELTSPD